jgi:hypothetical protein
LRWLLVKSLFKRSGLLQVPAISVAMTELTTSGSVPSHFANINGGLKIDMVITHEHQAKSTEFCSAILFPCRMWRYLFSPQRAVCWNALMVNIMDEPKNTGELREQVRHHTVVVIVECQGHCGYPPRHDCYLKEQCGKA